VSVPVDAMQILQLSLGPIQTNGFIAADDGAHEAAIIDPGGEAPRVLDALKERNWQARHILLTHAHFDHIGAVADLVEATGASLCIHPLELPLLRQSGGARLWGMHIRPCPEPDVLLEAGQMIEVGRLRFEVLFVPGHTPGHVAFYEAQAKAVFSGDVLFQDSIGRTDLPGGDHETLMRSLREVLLALPDDVTVCPGHGPLTTIGAERLSNPFLAD
jgi:glyoxylase-like metal-dependent hydrolase (beta-lactamase superfamily II)